MRVTTKNMMLLTAVVVLFVFPLVLYRGATDQQNGPETAVSTTQGASEGAMPANETGASTEGASQAPTQEAPARALFSGSDDQGKQLITTIDPGYKPWFSPIWEPPSSEIESLLFALQAALGAGFVGYYFGYTRGKRRQEARS